MSLIYFSFLCAVIAFIYSDILVQGDMILNPWYKFLEKHLSKKPWLFKPLVDCSKCVAGQVALWSFPFFYKHIYNSISKGFYSYYYSLFEHVACICLAILMLLIIKSIHTKFITKWLMS